MNFPFQLEARTAPSRTMQLAVPLIAVLATLAIGFLIFGLVGKDPVQALHAFFIEPLSTVNGWSELLLKASPLCLIGLGLAIGYRANIWNIGAEGQMLLGGIAASGVAIYFDQASGWWILPLMMLAGVVGGIAWASILSMPYAILSSALPAARIGIYMGVFNFFIVIPEITQALTFGPIIRALFGADNHNAPLYMVMVGGVFMLIAALLVMRVQDVGDRDVPEDVVISADEHLPIIPPETAQPVPSTGLIDHE